MTTLKDPPKNILVPIDFSEPSEKAAIAACALAAKTGATVHLLHAYVIPVESVGLALTVSQQYVEQFVKESKNPLPVGATEFPPPAKDSGAYPQAAASPRYAPLSKPPT